MPPSCCVSGSLPVAGLRASRHLWQENYLIPPSLFFCSCFLLLDLSSLPLLPPLRLPSSSASYTRESNPIFVSGSLLIPFLPGSLTFVFTRLPTCPSAYLRVFLATASCPAIEPRGSWEPCAWAPPHDEQPS
ncbi:hypothetical protein M441DRAFT_66680 [Trichoderma asperellum CBS 433.97]|uniref:Uncharacterized protein n=1 Tax=Trichoderma asperellum (strain ATCC 204424 / CBS 433.97 / NBRC 101777) TaxID=1042311 RepID=A0A2T3ZDM0_TRIA4|nr:hypothetical protein M441DRAFT_66680 [Trichoderma asperellum CBS 433.97]PTB42912.1 hypothetical protein M441DRAFT_66680 [Trichoderma asperellum CBS 433.97]